MLDVFGLILLRRVCGGWDAQHDSEGKQWASRHRREGDIKVSIDVILGLDSAVGVTMGSTA